MLSREGNETGAPNDGLLKSRENDHSLLLKYIENTFCPFSSKEMYSKRCYKLVSQCSAILGELEYIRNYEESGIIFAKILDVI